MSNRNNRRGERSLSQSGQNRPNRLNNNVIPNNRLINFNIGTPGNLFDINDPRLGHGLETDPTKVNRSINDPRLRLETYPTKVNRSINVPRLRLETYPIKVNRSINDPQLLLESDPTKVYRNSIYRNSRKGFVSNNDFVGPASGLDKKIRATLGTNLILDECNSVAYFLEVLKKNTVFSNSSNEDVLKYIVVALKNGVGDDKQYGNIPRSKYPVLIQLMEQFPVNLDNRNMTNKVREFISTQNDICLNTLEKEFLKAMLEKFEFFYYLKAHKFRFPENKHSLYSQLALIIHLLNVNMVPEKWVNYLQEIKVLLYRYLDTHTVKELIDQYYHDKTFQRFIIENHNLIEKYLDYFLYLKDEARNTMYNPPGLNPGETLQYSIDMLASLIENIDLDIFEDDPVTRDYFERLQRAHAGRFEKSPFNYSKNLRYAILEDPRFESALKKYSNRIIPFIRRAERNRISIGAGYGAERKLKKICKYNQKISALLKTI